MPKKRTRRTAAEMTTLRERIQDFLEAQHPASARNLFYRLVQDGLVAKSEAEYRKLVKLLVRMRRDGDLPYRYLSDATRQGYHVATFGDPSEFVERYGPHYRWDMWAGVPSRVEIWCESAALTTVLQPVHRDLAVSLFPCRGYSSITFAYEAAMAARRANPAELVILYVGDMDKDGRNIDVVLMRELRRHVAGQFPVIERRVAVNDEQVDQYGLPTRPDRDGKASVQAEALEPSLLRRLVESAIMDYLPWERREAAERETRAGQDTLRRVGLDLRGR